MSISKMLGSLKLKRLSRKHDYLKVRTCRRMGLFCRHPCNEGSSFDSTSLI